MAPSSFRCYYVTRDAAGQVAGQLAERPIAELPAGDVLIRVQLSSLNYKDALAAQGHPGVVRALPHVPGIDAAGVVVESGAAGLQAGDEVLVTGYELGAPRWGGWAEYIRVPGEWVVPRPAGLSLREAMILGTAGFTAAQCVAALEQCHVRPEAGEVVVTGATGGVGCLAVRLLARLGYQVVAVTGKAELAPRLQSWGAARVIGREDVNKDPARPLLSARWAGAVDTVGGNTLATLLRETHNYGCVAACGLVGGADLPLTVHPFILRGVTLAGIASASLPREPRLEIWRRLAGPWRIDNLEELATSVPLADAGSAVARILRGAVIGRTLIEIPPA